MSRTIGGQSVSYVWDVAADMPYLLQDGTSTYVYGLGMAYWVDGAGNPTYRLTDALGSTATLIDASGAVIGSYTYDAFGNVRSHTGSSTEFSYTGEQNDPNGFEFLRARYYDPTVGRFLGRDPFGGGYPYVRNSPINRIDPLGLFPICSIPGESPVIPPPGVELDASGCFDSTAAGMPSEPPITTDCSNGVTCSYYFGYAVYTYLRYDFSYGLLAFAGLYDSDGDGVLDTYGECLNAGAGLVCGNPEGTCQPIGFACYYAYTGPPNWPLPGCLASLAVNAIVQGSKLPGVIKVIVGVTSIPGLNGCIHL